MCGTVMSMDRVCNLCVAGGAVVPRAVPHLSATKPVIREALMPFFGEHRLEVVHAAEGVTWVNDCRAVTTNATWYALEYSAAPVVLILSEHADLSADSALLSLVMTKVTVVYLLCADREAGAKQAALLPHVLPVLSMHEAVVSASVMADRGDTVLLSPASDKLMPYADYEAMGRDFKREVARL